MGVKNLWDILESCKKTLPLHHLRNKRVCVDLSCWMVQLQSVYRSHCPTKDKLHLKGLFHRLRALIALNCSLIFVSDGSIPAIKLSAYRRRLNAGNEAIQDAKPNHDPSSLKRNMGSEFSCMIKEAKLLGLALGIPCLDGIEEAEAQCALLNSESLCDGCFTSDSDAFLFGAKTVYRDICLGDGGYVICYEMDDIEQKLGFGRDSLITLAILLGSDYNQGVRGFGPESACQIVKSIGDSALLQQIASEGFSFAKKPKNIKKKGKTVVGENKENCADNKMDYNGSQSDLPTGNQYLQVINAYTRPKCHSANSDAVQRVLALCPVNRSQLHQICTQYFDWPPTKTDEYILPKIAERHLRRYANLRSLSSELGVHLPINEMPVKCPISSIVKQRKVQGRDYFEVSWEDVERLKSSVVPADLVESACPEKIVEFQQSKAQKPRKSRQKKKEAELNEIDRKLQELLVDIEQESTASHAITLGETQLQKKNDAGTSRQKKKVDMRAEMKEVDRKLQELLDVIDKESTSSTNVVSPRGLIAERSPGSSHVDVIEQQKKHSNGGNRGPATASTAPEIVDLVSPAPRAHTREVSRLQEARCVEVVDLSDMDDDGSPEHARKMREVRLFMANIRDEAH